MKRSLQLKIYAIALGFIASQNAFADNAATEALKDAYQSYYRESNEYITTMQDATNAIRDWRKKKLAETFDNRLSVIEQNLFLSNQNLIDEFNKFLKANGSQALDDVLLIRLAQLHFEKANLKFNQDMKAFQQKSDASQNIPVPNYAKTIAFAKKFLENYPNSPIGDKAYYLIGFCNEEMSRPSQSIDSYKKLLIQFPTSEYGDEVSWRLAEIYYTAANYRDASPLYERLIKTKGPFFTKALYKLGATQVVQKDFANGAKTFQKLIDEIDTQNLTDLENLSLRDESLDYLATITTQNASIEIAEDFKPELYYRIGLLYKKRLDEKSMRQAFIEASQKYPNSRFMPLYYSELVESFDSIQDTEKANYYRSQFIKSLTDNQKWWNTNDEYKDVVFQAQDMLEFALLKSAEYYADKGYTKKDFDMLKVAKNRYYNFITQYSWSPYRDNAKLELADLEYYLGNYPTASKYYFEIVNETDSEVLREEAAYSLIWSEVKKVNYSLNFDARALNIADVVKSEMNVQEKAFVQAALFYNSKIKISSRKDQILYKLAEVYIEHGDVDNAVSFLNNIISDNENPSLITVQAYRFLSEIYNLKGDYNSYAAIDELYHTTFFSVDINGIDKDSILQKYRDKLEKALNFELKGLDVDAAQEYERVSVANAGHPMNAFLNLKIASLYLKSGEFDRANDYIRQLEMGPYKAEALFLKAKRQYQLGQFDAAAKNFEAFENQYKNHSWVVQAQLNAVSIHRQLKENTVVADLVKKITVAPVAVNAFYDQLTALLDLKKYDVLYKTIDSLKKTKVFDVYKLQSFILRAQLDRDDYVGLERNCAAFSKIIESQKRKSAEMTHDSSLCEQYKLRTVLGQTQTTLDDIVGHLNKIYAFKVEIVTLAALNDIISKSALKEIYKPQFAQLMQKGWSIAQKYPLHPESLKLAQNIYHETGKLPVSLTYMQNWNISLAEQLDWRNFLDKTGQWAEIKLDCDTKHFQKCIEKLEQLYGQNPDPDILENILIASLKAQEDGIYSQYLKKYLSLNQNDRAQMLAMVTSRQNMMGGNKEIPLDAREPLTTIAKSVGEFDQGLRTQAQETLAKAIESNSKYSLNYLFLARMYMERNFPELALSVLQNGYQNTTQRALLPALYQMSALVYTNSTYSDSDTDQDQSPAAQFAIAFSALKNKDIKRVEKTLDATKKYSTWFDMIKSMQLVYTSPKDFKETKSSSDYILWLQQLYKMSNGENTMSVTKNFAFDKGYACNYRWVEKSLLDRDVATEKK